jgi:6-phosphogluconate dehydrogenase
MSENATIGLIGLGTMGANLALNIAEAGHRIAVFNRSPERTRSFSRRPGEPAHRIVPTETLEAFVDAIAPPRMILMMVPAGAPVTEQIDALTPLLSPGDILIDGGNSDWKDSEDRATRPAGPGPRVSRARSVSAGRKARATARRSWRAAIPTAWDAAEPILTSIAATFGDSPCAAYFGAGGAGHYVKTVHNGIEYADMQMIAETYGLMRDGQGRAAADIAGLRAMERRALESYLIEISAEVAAAQDPDTGAPMLDVIADRAGQKGTGRWTVIDAQRRAAPLPAVEAAVSARVSVGRGDASGGRGRAVSRKPGLPRRWRTATSKRRCWPGKILAYSQGFTLLSRARAEEGWTMPLDTVARTWRAGCIIRSAMLDDMAGAGGVGPGPPLAFAPGFAECFRRPFRRSAPSSPPRRGGPAGPGAVGGASAFRPDAPGAGHGQHDPGLARPVRGPRVRARRSPRRDRASRPVGCGPLSGGLSSPDRSGGRSLRSAG